MDEKLKEIIRQLKIMNELLLLFVAQYTIQVTGNLGDGQELMKRMRKEIDGT